MDLKHEAQDRVQWQNLLNRVMDLFQVTNLMHTSFIL